MILTPKNWLSPQPALLGAAALCVLVVLPAATAGVASTAAASQAGANAKEPAGLKVVARRCLSCHNPEKKAGGLDLSTRAAATAGGLTAKDDPARNPLVRVVTTGKMPPTGKLPAEEIAALRAWARDGLLYPTAKLEARTSADEPLWSLAPVRRAPLPVSRFDRQARNPIDRFVFARLQAAGLQPSPPAGRLELLRRVTLDLTGLPPTPGEIDAFQADRAADAYEKVVDRLLASPAYGERWGQHWLDVVRYGESNGYEQNHLRANAWPYRDYVIRSLNEDKPYDRFVREQLAGDVLAKGDPAIDAATGFLVAGIHDTVGNGTEEGRRQQRANDLDDIVGTTAETFLGLTVGCAKCHDHKFDPIPQKDFYRLAAVFAGVRHGERRLGMGAAASADGAMRYREDFPPVTARFVRFTVQGTADGNEPCLDELEVYGTQGEANLALAAGGAKASASSLLPGYPMHQVQHLNDGKLGNDHSWISQERGKGWAQIELPQSVLLRRVVWSRDGGAVTRFRDRIPAVYSIQVSEDGAEWKTVVQRGDGGGTNEIRSGQAAYAGLFGDPEPIHLLRRGDVMQREAVVMPAALSRMPGFPGELGQEPAKLSDAQRRLALADWMVDPRNPLTARVIVNRLWHGHFGRGLVGTPSDFGHNGEKPSHPELLDFLAATLTADRGAQWEAGKGGEWVPRVEKASPASSTRWSGAGWSLKSMHRLIVTSATYRQSNAVTPQGEAVDAGNQLLWRMPLRRMEAEVVRDAVLSVSGKLDRRMGGGSYQLFKYRVVNVAIYETRDEFGPETWRRGVYRQNARAIRDDLLGTLDCPESSQRTPRRVSTTTALQALSLLNGSFMVQQAGFLAERVRNEAGSEPAAQAKQAFRLTFGREPRAEELVETVSLIRSEGLGDGKTGGLLALCRALLNANEFLYY